MVKFVKNDNIEKFLICFVMRYLHTKFHDLISITYSIKGFWWVVDI